MIGLFIDFPIATRQINWSHTFTQPREAEPFRAWNAARDFLLAQGFSVGKMDGRKPLGLIHGAHFIPKWRFLSKRQIETFHGLIASGSHYRGPVRVQLFGNSPVLPKHKPAQGEQG